MWCRIVYLKTWTLVEMVLKLFRVLLNMSFKIFKLPIIETY